MRFLIRFLMLVMLLTPVLAMASFAQEANEPAPKVVIDKRKLLVPPKNPDGSFMETPFSEDPLRWARDRQQNLYREMSSSIRGMKSSSPLAAGCALVFISFLYGVFHAAGPGHGKAVISAWLLATENELRRGVLVAAMSAFFQAMTAIVIVSALLLFVQGAAQMARDVAGVLESVSYLMIAGMGLYLIAGALKSPVPAAAVAAGPFEIVNPLPARHDHVHDEMCGCGHAHVPEAKDVRGDWSLRRAAALAFAVGLRPCSGALLVLIASWGLGLFWAGVVSTLAMGLGVFITISAIAALSVYGKGLALRLAAAKGRGLSRAFFALRLAGGGTILALGGFLFWASLGSQNAFM